MTLQRESEIGFSDVGPSSMAIYSEDVVEICVGECLHCFRTRTKLDGLDLQGISVVFALLQRARYLESTEAAQSRLPSIFILRLLFCTYATCTISSKQALSCYQWPRVQGTVPIHSLKTLKSSVKAGTKIFEAFVQIECEGD